MQGGHCPSGPLDLGCMPADSLAANAVICKELNSESNQPWEWDSPAGDLGHRLFQQEPSCGLDRPHKP